ncbi:MAG: class 1 fructose-bisphosphatase [Desulfohalobiaceae bacterium]|nr:class 1 fructose-bisphosphatase [Desulfohalobiaceae bacterium]
MHPITVTEHLLLHQKKSPMATGQFTSLLNELILSAKVISREVNKAGLGDILGETGEQNASGDTVKRLDEFAHRILVHRMERAGVLCAMASEEQADVIQIPAKFPKGEYILVMDPLDGSSNIEANVSIGTIFSIYRSQAKDLDRDMDLSDLLQKGSEQVAAGYFIYGSSTVMVYTTGRGVHGFTLDPSVGEFLLSFSDVQTPDQGKIYSVNEAYWHYWDGTTQRVVSAFKDPNSDLGRLYSLRYIGSLVADFHRNLLYGGVFMYPTDYRDPKNPKGKLRLLFEAAPLAKIAEEAGGMATDGVNRILDLDPRELHQRTPLFIGSRRDVQKVKDIYEQGS